MLGLPMAASGTFGGRNFFVAVVALFFQIGILSAFSVDKRLSPCIFLFSHVDSGQFVVTLGGAARCQIR